VDQHDAYIERATYRGHEGVRRYLGTMEEEFEDVRVEPVELIDAGEQVISSVRVSGRGKGSGAPVELTLISVGWLRNGVAYRIRITPTWPPPSRLPGFRSRRCRSRTSRLCASRSL
jgi:ketosteroid isomerase-like protein